MFLISVVVTLHLRRRVVARFILTRNFWETLLQHIFNGKIIRINSWYLHWSIWISAVKFLYLVYFVFTSPSSHSITNLYVLSIYLHRLCYFCLHDLCKDDYSHYMNLEVSYLLQVFRCHWENQGLRADSNFHSQLACLSFHVPFWYALLYSNDEQSPEDNMGSAIFLFWTNFRKR